MKKQYCHVMELMNYGVDSRGNTRTLYPMENLIYCGDFGVYARVKKDGRGNFTEFLINKSMHTIYAGKFLEV